jgi:hypothetical protein
VKDDIVVTTAQAAIYELLKEIGPTTDMDLLYTLQEKGVEITGSGLRHRRHRLVQKGKVAKTKQTVNKPGGKPLIVWKAR